MESIFNEYHKIMTRPLSLVDCEEWDITERLLLPKKFNNLLFYSPLFIYTPGKSVEIYYDFTDPKQDPKELSLYLEKNLSWFSDIGKTFESNCKKISELINSKSNDFNQIIELLYELWTTLTVANTFAISESLSVSNELKEISVKIMNQSDSVLHPSLTYINKLISEKINHGTQNLLLSEFLQKKLPSDVEESRRERGWLYHNGRLIINYEEYLKDNNIKLVDSTNPNTDDLKGKTAWKGLVQGKVRVVYNLSDLNKTEIGDIIVCPMTTPEMTPVLRKAKAIITDEGGIMCHAAIIARELQIPCVVGTKSATKTLRDNDLVEVDANSGVIRVLKRA
jgi:phosphohistidine swiveling domain-containing protein